jgi:NADPH:quinone reductase-like Zn-dependent oxidoreductase
MRVARSVGVREVRLDEDPDPEAGAGEVVCRVLACGVCGSDVLDAWVARKVPAVLGHEIAAEVEQVGAGVSEVAPGDRVVVHHHAPCGECRRCRRGHETLCDRFKATGLHPGGFAERVRVPADLVDELLVVNGMDRERATFVEPLACVLRAFARAGSAFGLRSRTGSAAAGFRRLSRKQLHGERRPSSRVGRAGARAPRRSKPRRRPPAMTPPFGRDGADGKGDGRAVSRPTRPARL